MRQKPSYRGKGGGRERETLFSKDRERWRYGDRNSVIERRGEGRERERERKTLFSKDRERSRETETQLQRERERERERELFGN